MLTPNPVPRNPVSGDQRPPPPTGPQFKNRLDYLQQLLHNIFIQTAHVFNEPRRLNSRTIIHTNAMIRQSIPSCIDKFQYGLDCLEIEILRAKVTLRRDLEIIRQRNDAAAERELEEARARALAEEVEKKEREEKEALERAAASQSKVAGGTEGTNHPQNSGSRLPENAGGDVGAGVALAGTVTQERDVDMLFGESPVQPTNPQLPGRAVVPGQTTRPSTGPPGVGALGPGGGASGGNFGDFGVFGKEFNNVYQSYP